MGSIIGISGGRKKEDTKLDGQDKGRFWEEGRGKYDLNKVSKTLERISKRHKIGKGKGGSLRN